MTGIISDDEADLEAEIQRELDEISEENLEIEDLENEDLISPYANEKDADVLPDSLQQYLRAVQSRTEGVEQDVKDCDTVLNKLPIGSINDDDKILAQKIKEALGDGCHDNPLDIRNKVLLEIEELEQNEEKEKIRRESNADNMAIDIIRTDISDQIRVLEEAAEKQLLELEEKQANKNQKRAEWYEDMKREENERMKKGQEARKQRQQELEAAQKRLNENQQVVKEKLEKEAEQEKQKIDLLQQQFQVEIKEIEEISKKEKAALDEMKNQEAEYQRNKQYAAAVKIQKTYRGHRVYQQHKEILQQRRTERIKKYEEELEQQEQEEKRKIEERERQKQEEKRIQELQEKKRIEEERKRKEEQWKKEREEEKIREEEKRKMEQLRKQEEEKKRREAEERKEQERREEEKREMEQLRKQEEEKKRKEVEEQEEQKRREEEKREMEEMRKEQEKKIEEAKKRELELIEKQKKEEEDRRKAEEKEKMEELIRERERKELEQKKIEEDKKGAVKRKELEEIEKQKKKEGDEREVEKRKGEKEKLEKENSNPDINRNLTEQGESGEIRDYLGLERLEERRQQWLKDHTPWSSTTSEDRVQPVAKMKSRQRPRRPFSASRNLPSLTEEQLLQASPPNTPLNKVVRVYVHSLPACNMHGLKCCPDLQSLTIHDCGLMAVEGLEECTNIRELSVQNNCIEYVSCKDLRNIQEILLNNNNLTSLQGFDGCKGLRYLDLTNNKITRLGDLSSCCKLQVLRLDNNQLIMTRGLSSLLNLQSLSCAINHLPNVKEIDSCQLLQSLNLQGNNLQQPPLLSNHVLLREIRLDDNSISTLEPLSQVYLPSLRLLSASQNSISKLESLDGLVMLQTLDVSHNLISDLDSLIPGLSHCRELKDLRITGNPVNEDPGCRKAIIQSLSFLTRLDDETLQPKQSSSEGLSSPFIVMCHAQLQEYTNMISKHAAELSSYDEGTVDPKQVHERLNVKSKQYEERHQLAVTHLQQHERYGTGDEEHPRVSHDAPGPSGNQAKKIKIKETISKPDICALPSSSHSHDASASVDRPKVNDGYSFGGVEKGREKQQRKLADDASIRTRAAVKIQSVWRGWHVRHLIDVQMKKWLAAVTIQATWRGYRVRSRMRKPRVSRARRALWDARHDAAATVIQACYRGYRVRQRIASALRAVNYYDDDDDDDDDFNYDEEVDLSAFDYDSGLLDEGWTPTDTPQLPSRGPILPAPGQSSFENRLKQSDAYMPRQAWRSADSPMEQDVLANPRGGPRVHSKQHSPEHDLMSVTSGTQSHSTHRAEEMSNEWGLKDPSTAELMWKRANRMKYNPARKRKLLDPNKRLALFKKLDEANKLREVKPPPKRQPGRIDYFAARDASVLPSGSNTPTSERQTKAQMTYSWVYNQGVIHVDQDEPGLGSTEPTKNKKSPGKRNMTRSPINLPQMDPVALTGRNVSLVSSPSLMRDQMSKDSTSKLRRYSSASEPRSAVSETSSLNPEKSNSAGARMTKERRRR